MQQILTFLDDGKQHPLTDLRGIQLPTDELDAALEYLFAEEYVLQNDGFIYRR